MSEPSWNDLARQPAAAPRDDKLAQLCAEVFTSPAGKELLAEWKKRWFDLGDTPYADERALRVRAGIQHFLNEIERATARGLSNKVAGRRSELVPGIYKA